LSQMKLFEVKTNPTYQKREDVLTTIWVAAHKNKKRGTMLFLRIGLTLLKAIRCKVGSRVTVSVDKAAGMVYIDKATKKDSTAWTVMTNSKKDKPAWISGYIRVVSTPEMLEWFDLDGGKEPYVTSVEVVDNRLMFKPRRGDERK